MSGLSDRGVSGVWQGLQESGEVQVHQGSARTTVGLARSVHSLYLIRRMGSPWNAAEQYSPDSFYRAYIDPPRTKRLHSLTTPRRSSPRASPLRLPDLHRLESQWNSRFHVSFSKDNPRFHVGFRQYFDSPKDLDYPLLSTQRQIFDLRIRRRKRS